MTGSINLWLYSCGAGFTLLGLIVMSVMKVSGDMSRQEEAEEVRRLMERL